MVAALVPTLPVVMVNGEGESVIASSPREYWQAVWGGYSVSGPVPAPPRNKIPATLADLDVLKGAAPADLDTLKEVSDELKGRLAQSTLSATFVGQPNLIADLPTPFYIGHRGAYQRYPEHTIEGYRACNAAGFPFEMDIQSLADGTLVPLHDSTVNRTMIGVTGNVNTLTRAQWKAGRIPSRMPGYQTFVPPTVAEVLNDPRCKATVGFHEIKNSGLDATNFLNLLKARGMQRSVVVCSFDYPACLQSVAAGFVTMRSWSSVLTTTELAQAKTDGMTYLGIDTTIATAGYLAQIIAAGLKPVVYTVTEKALADAFIANGAVGVYTDDPWNTSGAYPITNREDFTSEALWPGFFGGDGTIYTYAKRDPLNGGLLFNDQGATTGFITVKMGQFRAGPTLGKYRIRAQFLDSALADASKWIGLFIGDKAGTDVPFKDLGESNANGYWIQFRKDGTLPVYKVVNGATTALTGGTFTGTATALAAAGAKSPVQDFEFEVTATNVIAKNLTAGTSNNFADTTHRQTNATVSLGANSTRVVINSVGVSR